MKDQWSSGTDPSSVGCYTHPLYINTCCIIFHFWGLQGPSACQEPNNKASVTYGVQELMACAKGFYQVEYFELAPDRSSDQRRWERKTTLFGQWLCFTEGPGLGLSHTVACTNLRFLCQVQGLPPKPLRRMSDPGPGAWRDGGTNTVANPCDLPGVNAMFWPSNHANMSNSTQTLTRSWHCVKTGSTHKQITLKWQT